MRERTDCRVCGSTDLVSVLDLGEQPLANGFLTGDQLDVPESKYPLHLVRCPRCTHMQLTHVVAPEVLYADYAYQSGYAQGWHDHCESLALEIVQGRPGATVYDLGANDCTLLSHCLGHGCRVLGIDPSSPVDDRDGIAVLPRFWSLATAHQVRLFPGKADVIVGQNVLGHVDDPRDFLQGISFALAKDGVAILEMPWMVDLLAKGQFDTIYHEHLSYWGVTALQRLAQDCGLTVSHVRAFPDLHGGSLRYYLHHSPALSSEVVRALAWRETQLAWRSEYTGFQEFVQQKMVWWENHFQNPQKKVMAGYGASAKGSTFLNALAERPPLTLVFDDNPRKVGLYTPGHHYPVVAPAGDTMEAVEELVNLAPNWDLEPKARALGFTGEVVKLW